MNPKCAQAIQSAAQAAGRATLTKAQLQEVEDNLSAKMRQLARQDPPRWRSLTADQQLQEAGTAIMADIKDAAARKLENAQRQIVKSVETDSRVSSLQESFKGTKFHDGTRAEALKRDFELSSQYITALRKDAQGSLMSLIEAAGDKTGASVGRKFLMAVFDAENPVMTRDVIREIFKNADGGTGNTIASTAARAWLDTIEGLRTRFNAAGGDVGKLEYGYTPQPHDTSKVRKAGADVWADRTLPLLDRRRYLREDGSLMSDDEVRQLLVKAWDTISTEGLNKADPGQFRGSGARANRGADPRQIHFADGDAWLQYMAQFGRGSLYDAMMGHIGGMTKDIGLLERYGPNPEAQANLQFDLTARADGTQPDQLVGALSINPQTYWNIISGKVGAPANEPLARTAAGVRNLQTAAKLGGAVISSVTDLGTLAMTAGYNRLPYWQLVKDIGSQGTKETRDFMSAHGMIAESVADSLNRWSGDHLGSGWTSKLANSVMRLSFLNAWTDGLRQGFTMSMNAGLARMAKNSWGELAEFDRSRLTRAGITADDWAVLNTVSPTQFKGREFLTPQAIKASGKDGADALAAKVFGFIHDESEFAIVNPDLATRAVVTTGGTQAGTFSGEIARTAAQFKSFPVAMITRHWKRLLEGDHDAAGAPALANRVSYFAALMGTTVGLGAIALQEKQILQGKDPISMDNPRFWAKAVAQGGGFGIAGDLFLIDPSNGPADATSTFAKNAIGPTFGSASELLLKNITENIWQAADGKDTHWEAELSSWARSQTPGASLWWVKPMIDHAVMNSINENLSPGYLARMKARARRDWGQDYWWAPEDMSPDRAPDMAAAFSQ
jgi:hypothetical protein